MTAAGFDEWYRREHGPLVATLTAIGGDVALAADAADEAFLRAYERWSRVGSMASPGGWTYRTALNLLRRGHRRRQREASLLRRRSAGDRSGEAPLDWSAEAWDAIRRLPDRERTAVALRYIADLPVADIAEAMDIATGTVGSTLHQARRNLARTLGEPAPPEDDPVTDGGRDAETTYATEPGARR